MRNHQPAQNASLKIANAGFGGQSHKVGEMKIMKALDCCANWLGGRDSNPDKQIQSLLSYR
jgi:hypothetical protein